MSTASYPNAIATTPRVLPESVLGDVACFVFPALVFLRFQVGGWLYATDVCLLAALPFALFRHWTWLKTKPITISIALGVAWLAAQVLSDVIRESPVEDYARGWSKILFTVTHFATVALLIRDSERRFMVYGVGLAFGGILTFYLAPTEYAAYYPWKFGVGLPVTICVCLIAALVASRSRIVCVALLAAMGAVNLYLGFRSLGGVCELSSVCAYFQLWSRPSKRRLRTVHLATLVPGLVGGLWFVFAIYAHGAQAGWFGEEARVKYEIQSSGDAGVLLGGRNEILAAASAISDSPLIGHGSWAKDPTYKAILYDRMAELGYRNLGGEPEADLIPSHSYLLGAWVEAGIIGAVFWCWVLSLIGSALLRASGQEALFPFFLFILLFLTWNVLFSPYGGTERFTATYFIYAMILFGLYSQARKPTSVYAKSLHCNHFL